MTALRPYIALVFCWSWTLVSGAQTSDGNALAMAETAMRAKDWKGLLTVAEQELKKAPANEQWRAVRDIAILRLAIQETPRVRMGANQLDESARKKFADLRHRVGTWTSGPNAGDAAGGQGLLSEVKAFAAEYPDLTSAWILQGEIALTLNRILDGKIAARNLEELRAWETSETRLLLLLGCLECRGWMPQMAATAAEREELGVLRGKLTAVERGEGTFEAVLSEVKAFCAKHPKLPHGWLMQLAMAGGMNRSLEFKIAQSKIASLAERKSGKSPTEAK